MTTLAKALLLALTLLLFPGPQADARSTTNLAVGDGFQAGGVYFYVVAITDDGAVYRVAERLQADGHDDSGRCARNGRFFYHHDSCPAVQAHLARYGADLGSAVRLASRDAGSGSHPVNYLQGTYVKPSNNRYWGYWGYWGGWGRWSSGGGWRPWGSGPRSGFGHPGHGGFRFGFAGPGGSVGFRRW